MWSFATAIVYHLLSECVLRDEFIYVQENDAVLQEGMENNHFVQTIIINIVKVCSITP